MRRRRGKGAILDAYFSVPAALRSRIELAPKVESCNCPTPVSSDGESGFAEDTKTTARARAYPERVLAHPWPAGTKFWVTSDYGLSPVCGLRAVWAASEECALVKVLKPMSGRTQLRVEIRTVRYPLTHAKRSVEHEIAEVETIS